MEAGCIPIAYDIDYGPAEIIRDGRLFIELARMIEVADHRPDRFAVRTHGRCDRRMDAARAKDVADLETGRVRLSVIGAANHQHPTVQHRRRSRGPTIRWPVRRQRVDAGDLDKPVGSLQMDARERRRERALCNVDEQFGGIDLRTDVAEPDRGVEQDLQPLPPTLRLRLGAAEPEHERRAGGDVVHRDLLRTRV